MRRYLGRAIASGAGGAPGVRVAMHGRIKLGPWVPFTATLETDGSRLRWRAELGPGPLTLLSVTDSYAGGHGSQRFDLAGRIALKTVEGADVDRSAAGRTALEAIFAPISLLPGPGLGWSAASDSEIIFTRDLAPERTAVHLRIDDEGLLEEVWALRWGKAGRGQHAYIPMGSVIHRSETFGALTVPVEFRAGWWFGTPRFEPFFEARIDSLARA